MKKLCKIILTLSLVFTMFGCSSKNQIDEKALEQFETTMNNLPNMKSAYYSATINTKDSSSEAEIFVSGAYKGDPTEFTMKLGMNSTSEDSEPINYDNLLFLAMDKEYVYINLLGAYKTKSTITEDNNSLPDTESFNFNSDEIKPYLTKATLKNNVVEFEFDVEKINEFLKATLENEELLESDPTGMLASFLADSDGSIQLNTLTMNITSKDNMLSDLEMTLSSTTSSEEENVNTEVKIKLAFSDVNGDVEVNVPSDDTSYELTDDSLLTE